MNFLWFCGQVLSSLLQENYGIVVLFPVLGLREFLSGGLGLGPYYDFCHTQALSLSMLSGSLFLSS